MGNPHGPWIIFALASVLTVAMGWSALHRALRPAEGVAWSDIRPPRSQAPKAWRWVVLHHSGQSGGSSGTIDEHHRKRGWEGIGFHFVIGNGDGMRNGSVEFTWRWIQQRHGAHLRSRDLTRNDYNEFGIGVAMIGDFDETTPTHAQWGSAVETVAQLVHNIPSLSIERVVGARELPNTNATSPGANMDMEAFRLQVRQALARMN